jgi:hypothetical protein
MAAALTSWWYEDHVEYVAVRPASGTGSAASGDCHRASSRSASACGVPGAAIRIRQTSPGSRSIASQTPNRPVRSPTPDFRCVVAISRSVAKASRQFPSAS